MKIEEIRKEGLEIDVKFVLPKDEIDSKVSIKLNELQKKAKLPGFRPGKVPLKIIKDKFEESARSEVINSEFSSASKNYIENNSINLASDPKIEVINIERSKDAEFLVKIEFLPKLEAIDFSSIKIEKPILKLSEKDIEDDLKSFAENNPEYKSSKGKSAINDKVKIDFEGFLDDKAFEGGKAEKYDLILGSKTFIPGFEEQLIGLKSGDNVDVSVKFPENYHATNLANKDVIFKVHVHDVLKPTKSEINEDFAKRNGFSDLEDMKKTRSNSLSKSMDSQINSYLKVQLFNELEEILSFDIPKSMLNNEKLILKDAIDQDKSGDFYAEKTDEEINNFIDKIAKRRVRVGIALSDYSSLNSIKVTNDDIKKEIFMRSYSSGIDPNEMLSFFMKNKRALDSLVNPILEDKAAHDIINNKISLSEKEYDLETLKTLIEKTLEKIDF